MGYTTTFNGEFVLSKNLTDKQTEIINDIQTERHDSVYSYNDRRREFPSIWNQWIIEQDRHGKDILVWDEGEKFYEYVGWLSHLIKTYFKKWKVELNGVVEFQGEEREDMGEIHITNNVIQVYEYDFKLIDSTKHYYESIN